MQRLMLCMAIALTALAQPILAQAEQVPVEALNKDYEACMGGQSDQQDPQRAQYCNCVRDGMRSWGAEAYGNVVSEQSKAGTGTPTAKVEELAKTCITKVLH